ncbi:sodium-dependent glucose transporter 1 [Pygocentrus nattereri]|uniref:Major facilitator superfamily (MFS) profile domain-containing protein n=1 Tax=Pygocentrus nattereri TaxID=42514 RepID=A0A3B4DUJ3_PYGNA|nr:sodium-dependent glucose transporter 1 [Pygocentrus nattereri]
MARGGGKKKRVRFARAEEETLFEQRAEPREQQARAAERGHGACGRWMVTMTLCGSFLGLGMSISVLGPTLEDLAKNVNKNMSNISYVFAGRATGYIGGSLVGGVLFDFLNPHLLLGFAMLLTSFGMCAIPFCKKALILTLLVSSVGVSMGILDTGGNVLILNTWGDQAGPHLQALHFTFAAGAFVSPIIAKLLFGHDDRNTSVTTDANANNSKTGASILTFFQSKGTILMSMWAYIVIGAFILLVSFLFFVMYSRSSASSNQASSSSGKQLVAKHHTALIVLLSIFFFWYVGAEVAYGSFIFNYAKDYVGMEQPHAAGLNALFWGSFAAFRGLAIVFATCMYPGTMILLSLIGCTLSSVLLILYSRHTVALWSCTALYGASMATTFPSGISWVEQYTEVTGKSAAAFVVGAALGEMVLPASLGFLLGHVKDQPLLMYLTLITATITSILFPVMYKLASPGGGAAARKSRGRGRGDADESDRQALLHSVANDDEEAEPEEDGGGGDSEADQWNDADFEVIEMDDTSLVNSPSKVSASPPDALSSSKNALASSVTAPDTAGLVAVGESISVLNVSPRGKRMLDREKND